LPSGTSELQRTRRKETGGREKKKKKEMEPREERREVANPPRLGMFFSRLIWDNRVLSGGGYDGIGWTISTVKMGEGGEKIWLEPESRYYVIVLRKTK